MPRTRRRKRLSRMDAAVDAMLPYGFPVERVRKFVKELLMAYGGDEGWPFIEDCSYKELVDALLREPETDDLGEVGDHIRDKPDDAEEPAGPSSRTSDAHQETEDNDSLDNVPVAEPQSVGVVINNAEAEGNGWKDIVPDQTIQETGNPTSGNGTKSLEKADGEIPALPSTDIILSRPTTKSRRHLPCYGWIDSDEEDDVYDFITLQPGPMVFRGKSVVGREVCESPSGSRRIRKSRWDEKPDDP